MGCPAIWVCLMSFGDETGVLSSGRIPRMSGVPGATRRVSLARWGVAAGDWSQACGPALPCGPCGRCVPGWPQYFAWGGTFLLARLDPFGFQMKTVGTWRASDLCTGLGLAWGPGALWVWPLSAGLGTPRTLPGQSCFQVLSEPKLTDGNGSSWGRPVSRGQSDGCCV